MPRLDEVRKTRNTTLNFRVSEELHEELVWKADETGITVSQLIRQVLTDFIHHRQ